ncbi:MAG: hypothetical protein ACE5KH_03815, partial [Candidatus Geothermarchaeales archaeon]
SVLPDSLYKEQDPLEGTRHFYDGEQEEHNTLESWENGVLPWAVVNRTKMMTEHIATGDWKETLLDAGALSHYLADINQPYHTTVDYDPPRTTPGVEGLPGKHWLGDSMLQRHTDEITLPEEGELVPNYVGDSEGEMLNYAFHLIDMSYSYLPLINNVFVGDPTDPGDDREWDAELLPPVLENRTWTALQALVDFWYTAIVSADALDQAPDYRNYIFLEIDLRSVPITRIVNLQVSIEIYDGLFVPVQQGVEVKALLEGQSVPVTHESANLFAVSLSRETLLEFSGQTIKVKIEASKEGYGSVSRLYSLEIPFEETAAEEAPIDLAPVLAVVAIVAVIVVVAFRRLR